MRTIDRYIVWRVLRIMLATFAVGIVVLSLARLIIILRLRSIDDQGFSLVLQMLGYFLPNYFGFMLPFSLFWASFMVWRQLSGGSELRALGAAGISHARLIVPFMGLALATAALNLFVYGWLEPHARYNYRALTYKIENTAAYLAVRAGVFTKAGDRTVFVNELDSNTRSFKGMLIYENAQDGWQRQIIAAKGQLITNTANPTLRLEDGNRMKLKQFDPAEPQIPKMEENLEFAVLDVPLLSDEQKFYARGADEEELSIGELYRNMDAPPLGTTATSMRAQLNQKLIVILTALFLPFLAAPMAQSGPRGTNPLKAPLAFTLVILFQQVVDFGKIFAIRQELSPTLVLWPVFAMMCAGSIYAFTKLDKGPFSRGQSMASRAQQSSLAFEKSGR
jgi:lipopolysaccharide export system permease protein